MRFALQRDRVVASTSGLSVAFKKGVLTYVPPPMYQDVINVGAIPESELPEETKAAAGGEPGDPAEREMLILMAMEQIVKNGRREQFSAGGAPHGKALANILGWPVGNAERDKLWIKCQAGDEK
jgi:hypothetical protein